MDKNKIWPVSLTIILTLLIVSSIIFVFFTRELSYELVTEEYYQEGLNYQDQIDRLNNTKKLERSVIIQIMENNQLLFFFPAQFPAEELNGTVEFFRPDDKNLDFKTEIQVDQGHRQVYDASQLRKGNWKVKVYWNHKSKRFYDEAKILLQ